MSDIITLVTDFGLDDPYVAVMKGVILGINPGAVIVDISHAIEPQNIAQAAFLLGTAHRYFPEGTIHVAVVDPGVGSRRRAIILKTPSAYFVAPDNGLLSYVLADASNRAPDEHGERELGPGLEAVAITNPRFWRHPVSSTFHGRDIFAPVAAHLSLGVPLHEFGQAVHSLFAFPLPRPAIAAEGLVIGHVVYIDRFGNLVTDIAADLLEEEMQVEVCGHQIMGLSSCYSEGDELLALIGSSGYLEIVVRNGNAAQVLGAKIGDDVRVRNI